MISLLQTSPCSALEGRGGQAPVNAVSSEASGTRARRGNGGMFVHMMGFWRSCVGRWLTLLCGWQISPRLLTGNLSHARGRDALLAIVEKHGPTFNAIHVSTCLNRYSRCCDLQASSDNIASVTRHALTGCQGWTSVTTVASGSTLAS
jgi:hypothetical protein